MKDLFTPFEPIGSVTHSPDATPELDAAGSIDTPRNLLETAPDRPLMWPLQLMLAVVTIALLGRLVSLQVVHGATNQRLAEGNRIRPASVEAPRGLILDAAGRPLATNGAQFALELTPAHVPRTAAARSKLYQALGPLTGRTEAQLEELVTKAGRFSIEPIRLLSDIDHDTALALMLKTAQQPGVAVVSQPVRKYVTDGGLSHVLGYLSSITPEQLAANPNYLLTSQIGQSGVEATYDEPLRGQPGIRSVEVNATGEVQRSSLTTAPVPGKNVVLGINVDLQRAVADALKASLEENKATAGAAIGIDPRDGTVRFLVSLPAYDNNQFSHPLSDEEYAKLIADPALPMLNRVTAGEYPPGSVIKPVVASGGLASGVITKSTSIDAPAEIRVGDFVFPDWKRHGIVNVERAIAVSSDVFFYAVGGGWDKIPGLGITRLNDTLAKFGIGRATEIDLTGEVTGILPTPAWRKKLNGQDWYIGDTYHLSIGQGDLVMTPVQVASTIATIANGGTQWQPHVVAATEDSLTQEREPIAARSLATNVESAEVLNIVRDGMRQTITEGSGRLLNTLPLAIAGKTGSAEYGTPNKEGRLPTHAWFGSYAPFEQPQLAMVILAEGGGEGNVAAVPVAKTIYQWLIDHRYFDGDGQWGGDKVAR